MSFGYVAALRPLGVAAVSLFFFVGGDFEMAALLMLAAILVRTY